MGVKEILNRWDECGLKSLKNFSLNQHYTVLFDDVEGGGFSYLFEQFDLDKDQLVQSTNLEIQTLFEQIDEDMEEVSYLIEDFIINYLFKHINDENEIKNEIDDVRDRIRGIYLSSHTHFEQIKSIVEEENNEEVQNIH